ncbi:hypothetical protein EP331_04765 [bacterium]|nr:MAG: hypothetical protein EP331_04765 [bacterium]
MKVIVAILVFLFCFGEMLYAQDIPVDSTRTDSMKVPLMASDSLQKTMQLDSVTVPIKPKIKLNKSVEYRRDFNSEELFMTDSLSRWRPYNSISEALYWEKNFWTFRTWSYIRSAFISNINQIKPQFYVDGLKYRNPLGNQINPNLLPYKGLDELYQTESGVYIYSKQVKQTQPYTFIDADESGFGYTNVYGSFVTPLSLNQGLEVSLWNRSEDGEFSNSSTLARHMTAKYHYQLDDFRQINASVQYTVNRMDEHDGYLVEPIGFFIYDRFRTLAKRNRAYSSMRNNLYRLEYVDEKATWFKQTTLFLNLNRRFIKAPAETPSSGVSMAADTVDLGYRELGVQTASTLKNDVFGLNYIARTSLIQSNQDDLMNSISRPLDRLIWTESSFDSDLSFELWRFKTIVAQSLTMNSLVGLSGSLNPSIHYKTGLQSYVKVFANAEVSQQPIYSKKWSSLTLQAANLPSVYSFSGGLTWNWDMQQLGFEASVSSGYKSGDYAVSNNTFMVSEPYVFANAVLSAKARFGKFSVSNDATISAFNGANSFWGDNLLIWNRSMIAHEDYWFKRAAFIRNSFQVLASPFVYQTAQYQIFADDWIPSLNGEQIPGFVKLDYEMVARVRQLFISIRWENLTQGLLQNGYFETYPNPMFSRRLRFGIKVYFIN